MDRRETIRIRLPSRQEVPRQMLLERQVEYFSLTNQMCEWRGYLRALTDIARGVGIKEITKHAGEEYAKVYAAREQVKSAIVPPPGLNGKTLNMRK